jgi:RsiW-degrading membrane proteinase PrsW (M82 family)
MTMKKKKITFTHPYIYIITYMQFKQLDLKPQGSRVSRTVNSPRFKTTLTAILVGATISFLFFYFTEGRLMESIPGKDIVKSLLIGGFFGFFITNSPCARGRC